MSSRHRDELALAHSCGRQVSYSFQPRRLGKGRHLSPRLLKGFGAKRGQALSTESSIQCGKLLLNVVVPSWDSVRRNPTASGLDFIILNIVIRYFPASFTGLL